MANVACSQPRSRPSGPGWLLPLGAGLAALAGLWFLAVPLAFVLTWRLRSRPGLRACLMLPLGLFTLYYAATLASLPFGYAKVAAIGEEICALARSGALAKVSPEAPPAGLANIGPGGAQRLREMRRVLQPGCGYRIRSGNFGSIFRFGCYVLVLRATQEPFALSLELGFHPVLDFLLQGLFPLSNSYEVGYSAFISGDFSSRIVPGRS